MTKKNPNKKQDAINAYLKFIKKNGRIPSSTELDLTPKIISYNFGNMTKFHTYMRKNHTKAFENVLDESSFTTKRFSELKKSIKGKKRYIVTTAVVDKEVDVNFLNSIKNYQKRKKAELLVLPCADVASRHQHIKWNLDARLKDEHIVYKDLKLNSKIQLSAIKMSAKQINPLTGLSRFGHKLKSFVFAAPKQFLEALPRDDVKKHGHPAVVMTPGAVTVADYNTDSYMSGRTANIAEKDHILGALIIEIEDNNTFYFRHVQADAKDGSFYDLGVKYSANGSIKKEAPEAFVLGDYHVTEVDQVAKAAWKKMTKKLKPTKIFLHDFFNGSSVSHHEASKPLAQAKSVEQGRNNLRNEILENCKELNDICSWGAKEIYRVKSNHDDFLTRYLLEARYAEDQENHKYSLQLAEKLLDGKDPLQYAVVEREGIKNPEMVNWLQRGDSHKIAGIEMAKHGDKGANGKRNPGLAGLEKAFGLAITGHSHSMAILRGIWRVGTTSILNPGYTSGDASSWSHTGCHVYSNGMRQLITLINGKYTIDK